MFTTAIICSKDPVSQDTALPELTPLDKTVVEAGEIFGFKLFKEVVKEDADKNVFISPLSVSMALGMTLNGAAGQTYDDMKSTLELSGGTMQEINESYRNLNEYLTVLDSKVQTEIANSIWYRNTWTFKDTFLNDCQTYFDAEVSGLDFEDPNSISIMNDWVNNSTHGKIPEIVEYINPLDVMFLINAIYFKGTWQYEFDKEDTYDGEFNLLDGSKKSCKMMMQENDSLRYFSNDDFQAVNLPYGDGNYSMSILLPRTDKNIDDLIDQFNSENWSSWINNFSTKNVKLHLPRFKLEYSIKLNDALTALGMGIAFGDADFTKMYKDPILFISRVRHKTFVEVNEEGTEAAAVTVVVMTYGGPGSITMKVDRPFVFVIHEKQSNAILFIGKVINPLSE